MGKLKFQREDKVKVKDCKEGRLNQKVGQIGVVIRCGETYCLVQFEGDSADYAFLSGELELAESKAI